MSASPTSQHEAGPSRPGRRGVLKGLAGVGVFGALAAAYGTFAAFLGRFLYPSGPDARRWMFVARSEEVRGDAYPFLTPAGSTVNLTRRGAGGAELVALSSTCPHLGCQVHWEPQNQRFFCPCHNGIFDPSGRAISGPPADAGQSLIEYPTKVEDGLVFIELPARELAASPAERA
ncbi:MAG TPA: Rieske (2Fe-2S) protein [Thermoanaerobaculia bacterium]|nr:Rieske (2Fe-2S) protein [Thermoanaerobaculia bacterium]